MTDLRDGLGFLAEVDDHEVEELAAVTRDLAELTELRELFAQRAALQEEDAQLRLELQRLEPEAAGHDELRKKAAEARSAQDAASAEVRSHLVQIGALSRSALGGDDIIDVEAHIRELLAKHDVDAATLPTALLDAQAKVRDLQTRDEDLEVEVERLSASAVRRRVQRETLRRRSESDEGLKWLSQLAAVLTPSIGKAAASIEWPDETWQRLADHVAASRSALLDLVRDVSGLKTLAPQLPSGTGRLASAIKSCDRSRRACRAVGGAHRQSALRRGQPAPRQLGRGVDHMDYARPARHGHGRSPLFPPVSRRSGSCALAFSRSRTGRPPTGWSSWMSSARSSRQIVVGHSPTS